VATLAQVVELVAGCSHAWSWRCCWAPGHRTRRTRPRREPRGAPGTPPARPGTIP